MYGYGYRHTFKRVDVGYDADAIALFDAVGDVPEIAKPPINDLIVGLKNNDVWDNSGFWMIICVPTLDMDNPWIEIKSLTQGSNFNGLSSPFALAKTYPCPIRGYVFFSTNYATTDFIPSDKQTLNDVCEVVALYDNETTSANNFNYGSLNSTSQCSLFISNNSSGDVDHACHAYTASGRTTGANATGAQGVYLNNRRSATDAEVVLNGSVIATNVNGAGTLSTRNWYLNTYNNNGTVSPNKRSQSPYKILGNLGEGLSTTKRNSLATVFNTYISSTYGKKSLRTNQIVCDGNSHLIYQLSAQVRRIGYEYVNTGMDLVNLGVSSQTTQAMQADYATEVAPLYDGGLTNNILVAVEMTNDLFFGATKEDTFQNYKDYCLAAQATGYKVVAVPVYVRSHVSNTGGLSQTDWNLANDWLNTKLLAEYTDFADALAPVHPDAWIWRSDYASDAAYNTAVSAILADSLVFQDGATHLTEAAYFTAAEQNITAINTLV